MLSYTSNVMEGERKNMQRCKSVNAWLVCDSGSLACLLINE